MSQTHFEHWVWEAVYDQEYDAKCVMESCIVTIQFVKCRPVPEHIEVCIPLPGGLILLQVKVDSAGDVCTLEIQAEAEAETLHQKLCNDTLQWLEQELEAQPGFYALCSTAAQSRAYATVRHLPDLILRCLKHPPKKI